MTAALLIAYALVGFIVGARISVHIAWSSRPSDATEMRWWDYPGPFFSLLACLFAWPLALLVVLGAGHTARGLLTRSLFRPPSYVRERIARQTDLRETDRG